MSILNVTNLTDNPERDITDKYLNAFKEVEEDTGMSKSEEEKQDFINNQLDYLEEQMEEAKGKELLGIIDNYIVNLDYYSVVKEWFLDK